MYNLPLEIGTPRSSEKDEEGRRLEAIVMRTLKDIPETTHIPKLAEAAKLVLKISVDAQRAKIFKFNMNQIARETRALVYLISSANQITEMGDNVLPQRLNDQFDRVLKNLLYLNKFATGCSKGGKLECCGGGSIILTPRLLNRDLNSLRQSLITFGYKQIFWNLNKMIAMQDLRNSARPVMNDYSEGMDLAWASGVKPRLASNMVRRSSWNLG